MLLDGDLLYHRGDGAFDPLTGAMVQADRGRFSVGDSPYDPGGLGEGGFRDWFFRNSEVIAGTIQAGAWFIPGVGPWVGLGVNAIGSTYERHLDGQGWGTSIAGGVADATGVSGLYAAAIGEEFLTGRELGGLEQAFGALEALPALRAVRGLGRSAVAAASKFAAAYPILTQRTLIGGSVALGTYVFAGGGVQSADAGITRAVRKAAKIGRAYDRRFTRLWRQFEGQLIGDIEVFSVNRQFRVGRKTIQPDLVLINRAEKKALISDWTSRPSHPHSAKGLRYVKYFSKRFPGYDVGYKDLLWRGREDIVEALARNGRKYYPKVRK